MNKIKLSAEVELTTNTKHIMNQIDTMTDERKREVEFLQRFCSHLELTTLMSERQLRRSLGVHTFYTSFVAPLENATGKGSRTKKALYKSLIFGAHTVFKTEEEEYEFIQEYGRGIWDVDRNRKVFNEEEMETIRLIAESFGAFNNLIRPVHN